jgi:hypothetical protein
MAPPKLCPVVTIRYEGLLAFALASVFWMLVRTTRQESENPENAKHVSQSSVNGDSKKLASAKMFRNELVPLKETTRS